MPNEIAQDPTMEQYPNQQNVAQPQDNLHDDMSDDDIAATLGYITTLSESMMPKPEEEGDTEEESGGQSTEEEPEKQEVEDDSQKEDVKSEMEGFKKEIIDAIQGELGGIKDMVKQAINDEPEKE